MARRIFKISWYLYLVGGVVFYIAKHRWSEAILLFALIVSQATVEMYRFEVRELKAVNGWLSGRVLDLINTPRARKAGIEVREVGP